MDLGPQGAVLSPTLYSLYISDMKSHKDCQLPFYADGSAILSKGTDALVTRLQNGQLIYNERKWVNSLRISIDLLVDDIVIYPYG